MRPINRITAAQYKARRVKAPKYRNKKCEYDGHKFDSIKERDRYAFLKCLEDRGVIGNLQLQVPFTIQPSFKHNGKTIRAIKYVADFTYYDRDGKLHIEDTKGYRTKEYQLKKKLLLFQGLEIEEV